MGAPERRSPVKGSRQMTTAVNDRAGGPKALVDQGTTILIDRKEYSAPRRGHDGNILTGLNIRSLADPPIDAGRDLFEIVPGGYDRKVDDDTEVEISDGLRFFTAPQQINPGLGRRP